MLDECLSWNAHIEMIGIKISNAIDFINHLKLIYPQRILFTLYYSLIISHMPFGIFIYKFLYSHILIQDQRGNLNTYIEQHTHTQK